MIMPIEDNTAKSDIDEGVLEGRPTGQRCGLVKGAGGAQLTVRACRSDRLDSLRNVGHDEDSGHANGSASVEESNPNPCLRARHRSRDRADPSARDNRR